MPPNEEILSRVHREGKAPAILDKPVIDAIKQRRIEIIAAVDSFDATGVVLADRTRLEPDVVVAATGYTTGLEPPSGTSASSTNAASPWFTAARQQLLGSGLSATRS